MRRIYFCDCTHTYVRTRCTDTPQIFVREVSSTFTTSYIYIYLLKYIYTIYIYTKILRTYISNSQFVALQRILLANSLLFSSLVYLFFVSLNCLPYLIFRTRAEIRFIVFRNLSINNYINIPYYCLSLFTPYRLCSLIVNIIKSLIINHYY